MVLVLISLRGSVGELALLIKTLVQSATWKVGMGGSSVPVLLLPHMGRQTREVTAPSACGWGGALQATAREGKGLHACGA